MRTEFACGATLVFTITGILLSVIHLINATTEWLIIIYSIAAFAVLCLLGLAFLDPGVVCRSDKTCFPLPPDIAAAVEKGRNLSVVRNFFDPDADRSFCSRCLVWRPKDAHHCSICQRCVCEFDHHCGVFGRCIAGGVFPCRGNKPYFFGIILAGVAGMVVTFAS